MKFFRKSNTPPSVSTEDPPVIDIDLSVSESRYGRTHEEYEDTLTCIHKDIRNSLNTIMLSHDEQILVIKNIQKDISNSLNMVMLSQNEQMLVINNTLNNIEFIKSGYVVILYFCPILFGLYLFI